MAVPKNPYSLYIHATRPKRPKYIRFFFKLNNQTLFLCWLYWKMRWTQKVSCFKLFGDAVITLITLIHGHYLNSFEIAVAYCCSLLFSRDVAQLKWVTREARHHVSKLRNFSKDLGSNTLYQLVSPNFPKINREKLSLWLSREDFHLLTGEV